MRRLLLLPLLALVGCAPAVRGPDGLPLRQQSEVVAAPPADAYAAALYVAVDQGWAVRTVSDGGRFFTALTPAGSVARTDRTQYPGAAQRSLRMRTGDSVAVYVEPTPGGARVAVRSQAAQAENVIFVRDFLDAVAARAARISAAGG